MSEKSSEKPDGDLEELTQEERNMWKMLRDPVFARLYDTYKDIKRAQLEYEKRAFENRVKMIDDLNKRLSDIAGE